MGNPLVVAAVSFAEAAPGKAPNRQPANSDAEQKRPNSINPSPAEMPAQFS
jgi:hypothetical protein